MTPFDSIPETDIWHELQKKRKPVVLYGTGNGADKILSLLSRYGITPAGVFANDAFVRNRSFAGFPVLSYDNAKARFGEMIVLLAFGSHRRDVLDRITAIAEEQELYVPDVPVYGEEVFDLAFFMEHREELARTYAILGDPMSRELFLGLIRYKLSGKLTELMRCVSTEQEIYALLRLSDNERYFDAGAYTGDTVRSFLSETGAYEQIYAAEPDRRSFEKLSEYARTLPRCECVRKAVWSGWEERSFSGGAGRGSTCGKGEKIIFDSIDNILYGRPVSYIKMDVEGSEKQAIFGAEHTIVKYQPRLLIAAYHRSGDLFSIPLQVKKLEPNYRVFLRRTSCVPAWEINYIFLPEEG